ncbi:UNVERIFIED_CONTAM: hypothetical protein GTU68_006409 [Idotea baltica]|nr:hypothetical protein [Idotea baltica]
MNLQSVKQRFGIIGQSPLLDQALSTAVRVAATDLTVLVSGQSGVGKEVFSKVIHSLSARKHNTFIAVNCGAIPSGTINSELFGHEKGAFTGANSDRKGYFETANGGTMFLDEIGEMPLDTQAYLLRILESGEFIRVGSSTVQKTDVRIIAASNKNLEDAVYNGKFREDLYYRLSTVNINVPALRERKEDIYTLFRKFSADFSEKYRTDAVRLTEDARHLIEQYAWPGNIRELKNVAEQLSILIESNLIDAQELMKYYPKIVKRNLPVIVNRSQESGDLKEREILYKLLFEMKADLNDLKGTILGLIRTNNLSIDDLEQLHHLQDAHVASADRKSSNTELHVYKENYADEQDYRQPIILNDSERKEYEQSVIEEENFSLADMEKNLIKKALERHRGRRREAAEDLGISERTLYRKIKEYDLQ